MSADVDSPLSGRSGIAEALAAEIPNQPGYLIPCPNCTHVGVDGFPDVIRTPSIIFRPVLGIYSLTGCSGACSLCREIVRGTTPAEVATAWRDRVAAFGLAPEKHINGRKIVNTLQRMHARGLLPTDFPLPAGL